MCIYPFTLSLSDLILLGTAIIFLFTLFEMKKGNIENARLNRLQALENTILKQIEFHNSLLKGISINYESTGRGFGAPHAPVDAYGKEAFEIFYDTLQNNYKTMTGYFKNDINGEEKRIKDSFTKLYMEYGSLFGNYFKNLYLLVKYINNKDIVGFDNSYYIDLVKSQLSTYEILLLAYNCIWIQNKPKGENFIELAKNTNLLSALERDKLIETKSSIKHLDIFTKHYKIYISDPIVFNN